jgi:hypothetical protein
MVEDKLESGLRSSANNCAMRRMLDPDGLARSWDVLSKPTNQKVSLLSWPGQRLLEHGVCGVSRQEGAFRRLCSATQGMA